MNLDNVGELYPGFRVIEREAVVVPRTFLDNGIVRDDNADDPFDGVVIVTAPDLLRYQLGIVEDDPVD